MSPFHLSLSVRTSKLGCWQMEQRAFKNVSNCFNTTNCSYLETSGGQSSNPYLNVVHFFNASVN